MCSKTAVQGMITRLARVRISLIRARTSLLKVHSRVGSLFESVALRAAVYFFVKIIGKKFGGFRKILYLCNIKQES